MLYNFKRALGISVVLYIATFVVAIICGMVSGTDMSSMAVLPDSYWYLGMIAAAILTTLFAFWYFKKQTITASAKSGFLFGLTAVITSTVLDIIFFSLGNMSSDPSAQVDLGTYYGDYRFWIIIVIVLIASTLVGHCKKLGSSTPAQSTAPN